VADQSSPPSKRGGKDPEGTADRRRKAGPILPAGPEANEFATALMGMDQDRALTLLTGASTEGWEVSDVESFIIEPAVTRLGDLWTRGRLDDGTFRRAGALAESVELAWRQHLVSADCSPKIQSPPKRSSG